MALASGLLARDLCGVMLRCPRSRSRPGDVPADGPVIRNAVNLPSEKRSGF